MPARRTLAARLADLTMQRKLALAIGLLLILFVLASSTVVWFAGQQEANRQETLSAWRTLGRIERVLLAASAVQTAERDVLLFPTTSTRSEYAQRSAALDHELQDLRETLRHAPDQLARLAQVESGVRAHRAEFTHDYAQPPDTTEDAAERHAEAPAAYQRERHAAFADLSGRLEEIASATGQPLAATNQRLDRRLAMVRVGGIAGAALVLLLGTAILVAHRRLVVEPLDTVASHLSRLANQDHDFDTPRLERRDEIGEIARALEGLRQMSRRAEEQTWIRQQVASLSHLVQQAPDHASFAAWLLDAVTTACGAEAGRFHHCNDVRQTLECVGSHGFAGALPGPVSQPIGEGLAGQCAAEHMPKFHTVNTAEAPRADDGHDTPLPHLGAWPLLHLDTLAGVLELAASAPLSTLARRLLDEALPGVALALENLDRTLAAQALLARTQEQAETLRRSERVTIKQKQVLHDSNLALAAKTAELEAQSRQLRDSEEALRRQARALESSNAELRETSAQLTKASRYKSEFLASMSHELRTPLNSLLILSRHLAENAAGHLDAEEVESARIVHESGRQLLALVDDILDLSRVDAGKLRLAIGALAPADLIERLRHTFAPIATEKDLALDFTLGPALPACLHTDGERLAQIANNLVSNALKFTEKGRVSVRLARPAAGLTLPSALAAQPLVALSVEDTGIGIPADQFERIFTAFEQLDAGTSRRYGGTGLGLAISRRLAQLLGGDIMLSSTPGAGSCFTLLLPETAPRTLDPAAPAAESARGTVPPAAAPSALAGRRVLLADTDMRSLYALARVLRDWGLQVFEAADAEKAMRLVAECAPELVLSGLAESGPGPAALLARLRSEPRWKALPVIALGASAEDPVPGANARLAKPIDLDRLVAALHAWLPGPAPAAHEPATP